MKNPEIGLDTLHLNPVDFELSDHFTAKIKPASFDAATGETSGNFPLFTVKNRTFEGANAFTQLEHCTLEFNPFSDRKTGVSHVSTKLTLTVPKIVSGNNYDPATFEDTKRALEIAENELSEAGFKFNIKAALVKRCDAAKTVVMRDSWLEYRPALAVLKPGRMAGTGFETGQRWGNSRRQICLYDKLEEIASHFPKKQREEISKSYPKNSIRAELRLTERDSFRDTTAMETAHDLLSDFGHIQSVYRDQFEQHLFRFTAKEIERLKADALTVDEIANELIFFIDNEHYWLEKWQQADWVRNRIIDPDRLEIIKAAIKQAVEAKGLAKQNVNKKQKALENLYLQYAETGKSKRKVSDLYREIKDKILA
jgi:hypothetical protein